MAGHHAGKQEKQEQRTRVPPCGLVLAGCLMTAVTKRQKGLLAAHVSMMLPQHLVYIKLKQREQLEPSV